MNEDSGRRGQAPQMGAPAAGGVPGGREGWRDVRCAGVGRLDGHEAAHGVPFGQGGGLLGAQVGGGEEVDAAVAGHRLADVCIGLARARLLPSLLDLLIAQEEGVVSQAAGAERARERGQVPGRVRL